MSTRESQRAASISTDAITDGLNGKGRRRDRAGIPSDEFTPTVGLDLDRLGPDAVSLQAL